jgi:organic hydroperoxide reductase OsmC/OhrA
MARHTATVFWRRHPDDDFKANTYSRKHEWRFDGGITVPGSPSPSVVPLPMSAEEAVDPEEAFVASLSSCHMLFFLSIAAKRGFVVDSYEDEAVGLLGKGDDGKTWMTEVTLRPRVSFHGDAPDADALEQLHHQAHELCYIANSVRTKITVEP